MTFFTIAMAVLPSLFLVLYFIKKDVYTEPAKVIISTFFWGVLITIPLIFIEAALMKPGNGLTTPLSQTFYHAFVVAAGPEELFKYFVFTTYCLRHREFDEPMDGIVYGAVVSLGFATFENIFYVMGGGLSVAIMRAFTAVPAHACFGAIMGYYIAMGHFGRMSKSRGHLMGLGLAVLLHGIYDVFPFAIVHYKAAGMLTTSIGLICISGIVTTMIILIRKTLKHVNHLHAEQQAFWRSE